MGAADRPAHSAEGRGWRWGVIAVAAIGLSGCASTAAPGNPAAGPAVTGSPTATASAGEVRSAGSGALCENAGTVNRLTVRRVNSIPANHQHFSFPARVAVSDAGQALSVARALCALQPEPGGAMSCPADFGVTYRLDFATGGRSLPPVTIDASGCEGVSGTGVARWTVHSPAFWGVLGAAMGLPHPGHAAFAGTMPS
jgi:hypothetical protein